LILALKNRDRGMRVRRSALAALARSTGSGKILGFLPGR